MKHFFTLILLTALSCTICYATDNSVSAEINPTQRIRITIGDRVLTARIYDNATSRDFIAQLPITVDMTDFASSEKIFYPPQTMSTADRETVSDPMAGDINVYAPWGNIAIFYKNYSASNSLIRIGRIEEGIEVLNVPGAINNVTFEVYNTGGTGINDMDVDENDYTVTSTVDYIEVSGDVNQLCLYSVSGSVVDRVNDNRIETGHLNRGIYLLRIENKSGKTITKKVMLNR